MCSVPNQNKGIDRFVGVFVSSESVQGIAARLVAFGVDTDVKKRILFGIKGKRSFRTKPISELKWIRFSTEKKGDQSTNFANISTASFPVEIGLGLRITGLVRDSYY
jgi:hypothetical protein